MMAMLELEGFLLAMDATLDCLVMLQIRGVLSLNVFDMHILVFGV